jgi:hypothetical protein
VERQSNYKRGIKKEMPTSILPLKLVSSLMLMGFVTIFTGLGTIGFGEITCAWFDIRISKGIIVRGKLGSIGWELRLFLLLGEEHIGSQLSPCQY